jgi:hypothetical protein
LLTEDSAVSNAGWDQFRKPPRPPQRTYSPASGKGLSGIDRAKLDERELERRLERRLKEVWDE